MKDGRRVVFRTGGDRQIGLGHVRRCLSLAEALRPLGAECVFLLHGADEVVGLVAAAGFQAFWLEPGADDLRQTIEVARSFQVCVIVADAYVFQSEYFYGLGETGAATVVIDDLADRELPVNLVVNGAAGAEQLAYRGVEGTRYLLGPQYVLLRPEFAEDPRREIAERVKQVLITVGGSDPHNLTPRLMRSAWEAISEATLDVVIGPLFENQREIETEAQNRNGRVALHRSPENMRDLMLLADLALSSGGQTTYELAATGTPAIAVRIADNQIMNLKEFATAGALVWAGEAEDADLAETIKRTLSMLAADPKRRAALSEKGRALVDGRGAARVAQAILEQSVRGG